MNYRLWKRYNEITFTDNKNLNVTVKGTLVTFIGKDRVSDETKAYNLKFILIGTRLYLAGFKEVKDVVDETDNSGEK